MKFEKDLVVLTADSTQGKVVGALLSERKDSLKIREIAFDVIAHPHQDPGCVGDSVSVLRKYLGSHRYALVVFDRVGCGRESESREVLRAACEQVLNKNGWDGRNRFIVIDPELESWVWNGSNATAEMLGWPSGYLKLRSTLISDGAWGDSQSSKPSDPKASMERAMELSKKRRSTAVMMDMARRVSWQGCQDVAFGELVDALRMWFGSAHLAQRYSGCN